MIKYVLDENGKKTEVIVPIGLWNEMESLHHPSPRKRMDKSKLRAYAGKIKLVIDPLAYQQAMRDEWK